MNLRSTSSGRKQARFAWSSRSPVTWPFLKGIMWIVFYRRGTQWFLQNARDNYLLEVPDQNYIGLKNDAKERENERARAK